MTSSRGGKKMWCVGAIDAAYIARMEEVLATYEQPLRAAEPVVCLDERPVQLTADTRPPSRARPGRPARYDYEYQRHGTANLFCAVEPKAGWHLVRATPNRAGPEFAKVIRAIAGHFPEADTVHLVMDNLSTHTRKSLTDYYGEAIGGALWARLTVHYTPKHASWLNQAEIAIGLLIRECLGRRRIADLPLLRSETAAWKRQANRHRRIIQWRFTRRKARRTFGYRRPARAPNRSSQGKRHSSKPNLTRSQD
jgi:DDE superfamily endonuclease